MPNKLRLLPLPEIAEKMTNDMSIEDMRQVCFDENLHWLDDTDFDGYIGDYPPPEICCKPTLKEQLDIIFSSHVTAVNQLVSDISFEFNYYAGLCLQGADLELELLVIRGK